MVAAILHTDHARLCTLLTGISEMGMTVWILSRLWPKINAAVQKGVVVTRQVLEISILRARKAYPPFMGTPATGTEKLNLPDKWADYIFLYSSHMN